MAVGHKQKPQPSLPPFTRLPPIDEFVERSSFNADESAGQQLTGEVSFNALRNAAEELTRFAPDGNDVVVVALGLHADRVEYVEPHTLVLHGYCADGSRGSVIAHFTQLQAQVIQQPKRHVERVTTAFIRIALEKR